MFRAPLLFAYSLAAFLKPSAWSCKFEHFFLKPSACDLYCFAPTNIVLARRVPEARLAEVEAHLACLERVCVVYCYSI